MVQACGRGSVQATGVASATGGAVSAGGGVSAGALGSAIGGGAVEVPACSWWAQAETSSVAASSAGSSKRGRCMDFSR